MNVESNDSRRDTDSGYNFIGTPFRAAAILIGIYIAMYLAAAGIVHVLSEPNAAIASSGAMVPPAAAVAPAPAVEEASPPRDAYGQPAESNDTSRECRPSAGVDAKCVFD